ncbi:MAG: hypothetical protein EZS28_010063 [Streblomastix strix]|uniref:Uncharacterized protein n=1 Tax=Streblomastix strix TaxID=222440 RepID=A0A5J4WJE1_9EUKA|nr:MAG: hypothetical protein EZS28_010063 [Streblomastix strix]
MQISRQTLEEIHWWRKIVINNYPTLLPFLEPEAVFTIDASEKQWGTTLQLIISGKTIMFAGIWYNNPKWKLIFLNQLELAAILLGIENIEKNFEIGAIKSLRIQSDNSIAIFNLRRGAAALALCKLGDQILESLDHMKIQFSAFHIRDKDNKETNSFSRLSTSGNYGIRKEILSEALQEQATSPTIDYFANRRIRKCRRFYSLIWDSQAQYQDGMKANWKSEIPLLYPPISLIQRILSKVRNDQIEVILIMSFWQTLSWWTYLQELLIKSINLGETSDVLEVGWRMRKLKLHLPLGDVLIAHIKGKEVKNSSNKSQNKNVQLKKQLMIQLKADTELGKNTGKNQNNFSITGKVQTGNGKIQKTFNIPKLNF